MERIGLIGLGNIGKFYTKQLLGAGYPLTVLDLDSEKVKVATDQGRCRRSDGRRGGGQIGYHHPLPPWYSCRRRRYAGQGRRSRAPTPRYAGYRYGYQ